MKVKRSCLFIASAIALFLVVRSVNYIHHLNWSGDQATQSMHIISMLREHKYVTLIGNSVDSFKFQGRHIYQGPATYYMLAFFLFLGRFDPVASSYLFIIFCALMIFPLYYGISTLISKRTAVLFVILYTLSSFYIDYTRFLWNPNFQFALLPVLVFLMGLYRKTKSARLFLALSCFLGLLLQFHYQFIIIIFALSAYYFFIMRLKPQNLPIFVGGLLIGMSPLIIFELRNNFYNIQTALLILRNFSHVEKAGSSSTPHYWLSLSFFMILFAMMLSARRINKLPKTVFMRAVILLSAFLMLQSAMRNFPKPATAYWAPTANWNYPTEKKIYDIIKNSGIKDKFNVSNQAYDNRAMVTKFFLLRDNYNLEFEDYTNIKFLFVISEGQSYRSDPIEVASLGPAKIVKSWPINKLFNMHLLKKI